MKRLLAFIVLASLFSAGSTTACEYIQGETKFLDYAHCRYGTEAILVIDLPESSNWDQCVYLVQAFMPEKLLATTREKDGREETSINSRSSIGNPCYLMKRACDAVLQEYKAGSG